VRRQVDWTTSWQGFVRNLALNRERDCLDHILALPDGKKRFRDTVLAMTKAFAIRGTTSAPSWSTVMAGW
jgi:hypothetical protein